MAKITIGTLFLQLLRANVINRGINLALDPLQASFQDLFITLAGNEDSLRSFLHALDDSVATFQNTSRAIETQAISARTLVNELESLETQGLSTNEMQAAQEELIAKLNNTIPELGAAVGDCTKELRENIAAWRENAEAAALDDNRSALVDGLAEALEGKRKALDRVNDAQEEYNEALSVLNEGRANLFGGDEGEASRLQREYNSARDALNGLKDELAAAETAVILYDAALADVDGALDAATSAMDEMSNTTDTLGDNVEAVADTLDNLADSGADAMSDLQSAMQDAADSTAAHEIGETMGQAIIEGFQAVDFSPLPDTIDQALAQIEPQNMVEVGETAGSLIVDGFNSNDFSALPQAVADALLESTKVVEAAREMVRRAAEPVEAMRKQMHRAGGNTMAALRAGILSQEMSVMATVERIARNIERRFARAMQMNSPSRVMMRLGRNTMAGYILGLEGMRRRVNFALQHTAHIVQNSLNVALETSHIPNHFSPAVVGASDGSFNGQMLEEMRGIREGIEAGKHIILDTGELVGATAGQFDHAQGTAFSYNNRWGR